VMTLRQISLVFGFWACVQVERLVTYQYQKDSPQLD